MNARWIISLSVVGLCAALASTATAQQKKDADKSQMSPEMEAWMKASMPNANHERLNYMLGDWTTTVKMWEPGMDEASTSTGKCSNKWLMPKRYMGTEYTGNFMDMPFQGMGCTGYDNLRKEYFSIWLDSMSTGPMVDWGTYDEATRTFTYHGDMPTPTGQSMHTKTVIRIVNKNKHVMTMYQGPSKNELNRSMEITYSRSGDAASVGGHFETVSAGCASCVYHMDGVHGCKLAVEIHGKPYLVTGADASAHSLGLCKGAKQARIAGKIEDGKFVAKSFALK